MNDILHTIRSLRSIHGNFTDRQITDEDLDGILTASVNGASSSSRQAYSVIVIRNKETMKFFGYVGSVMLVFCADMHRQKKLAEICGYKQNKADFRDFITIAIDTVVAMQTAVIAAKSMGIDSLISNCIHRVDFEEMSKKLQLPEENCFPVIAVYLGYSDQEKKQKVRLQNQVIFHKETYQKIDETACRDLRDFYNSSYTGLRSVEDCLKDGFGSYLDWFFSHWSGMKKINDAQEPSEKPRHILHDVLEKTGFWINK